MVGDPPRTRRAAGGVPVDPREELPLGAQVAAGRGVRFRVWAPRARKVDVTIEASLRSKFELLAEGRGYFSALVPSARAGDRYFYRLDGRRLPDPASRSQPDGLAGPSAVVDPSAFVWTDRRWAPPTLSRSVLYELHVGTFTHGGTLDAAIPALARLAKVGVTTVELLPVSEERADTGWGYGPVFSFAVRGSYGGAAALHRFVDAAHRVGLAVLLDLVFTHWSGEAAFLERFGPYFHPRAGTPWGPTPNFERPGSDEVRRYFFECGRAWLRDYHVDGFRLDAVHEVRDRPGPPFWAEFSDVVHSEGTRRGAPVTLIAESDLNDVRILRPARDGGWGLDAQWADDFHSALHAALTGERQGYYVDFGPLELLARAFETPLLFHGQYSLYHDRRYGAPVGDVGPDRFVVFDQNHDQIGNRGDGARLTTLLGDDLASVGLALLLWSPSVPLLFMGEEYGETRPFYFFTGPSLRSGVRVARSRNRELRAQGYRRMPPNPSLRSTFERSRLDGSTATSVRGRRFGRLVTSLVALRRDLPALQPEGQVEARAWESEHRLSVRRATSGAAAVLLANIGSEPTRFPSVDWAGLWTEVLRSEGDRGPTTRAAVWSPSVEESPSLRARSFLILARETPRVDAPRLKENPRVRSA